MVEIAGTYVLVSSENYPEYLASFGLDEEQVERASQRKSPVVIVSADDEQIVILFGEIEKTFVFNEEVEHTLPTGHNVKTVATRDGDTITFKSETADGSISEERVFEFTEDGLTSTSTNAGVVATRVYQKIEIALQSVESE